jgi:transketolase
MTPSAPRVVDTLRFLAVDAVEQAKSGHPGLPLGAAPMAFALWDRVLKFNPSDPTWFDRDRFVLSAGHGSALLYALLHLYGYALPLEELMNFRQFGSRTPGHPEYGHTPGVEATTGPLGQGFGMGVGMAMAERHLGARFNVPGEEPIVNHYTYAICSDGDLMEGISNEAASLAGCLKLGKLIYLYDDNHVTIDGPTSLAFTENVIERFDALGWHTQAVEDGNDVDAIESAIRAAQAEKERPSLIRVHTHIGYGSPKQDSNKAHGEALGPEATRATKEKLNWPQEPRFLVPTDVKAHCRTVADRGVKAQSEWSGRLYQYKKKHADLAAQFEAVRYEKHPKKWQESLPVFSSEKPLATRAASGKVINALATIFPTLMGGSADLATSNNTNIDSSESFSATAPGGCNIHFGVRENAMGGAVNGMALHGGVIPFGATFLIFSDYQRPTIRLSALMNIPSTFIYTHDSIGLGEDGPTHQPVEQLMSLRAIPNFTVFRPADANETAAAWALAIEMRGPRALVLTRQALPVLEGDRERIRAGVAKGAYVLADSEHGKPAVVLIATGSEVHLALAARAELTKNGIGTRVVSMPSWELFRAQSPRYRASVLPKAARKVSIEAGATLGWREWVGDRGAMVGLDRFGASGPGPVVMEKLGFNVEHVVQVALATLGKRASAPRK